MAASALGMVQRAPAAYMVGKVTRGTTPVRSAWIILYDGSTQKARTITGDDGKYYIGGLSNKGYTIVVRRQATGANLFKGEVSLPANKSFNIKLP